MEKEILIIIEELLITADKLCIDTIKYQKLYNIIDKLYSNIKNYHSSRAYKLQKDLLNYISYNKDLIFYKEFALICKKILNNIKPSFKLNYEEEILEIALENYINGTITMEEYFKYLPIKERKTFDGKLTEEELTRLKNAGFKQSQIREIEKYVMDKKYYLNSFHDLVGDDLVPTKMFLFNIKHGGKIFTNDIDKTITAKDVRIRQKIISPLIKMVGGNFMDSKQIFENRNELMGKSGEDKGIELLEEPVIWSPNHHFIDDAMATVIAAKRPFYFMFGSLPVYFNTFDGLFSYLNGSIVVNRKNHQSKIDSYQKAKRAIELNADLFWAFEAVHNKTANKLVLDAWNGIYRIANEKGIKVVPIIHYVKDPTRRLIPNKINPIHTVIDDPIDLTKFNEKEGLSYLKDVISTWYYLMMEKYGNMTREELINEYQKRAVSYGILKEELKERPLTSSEIGTLYNLDLRSKVESYDKEIETTANFINENIISPEEAFKDIANIQNSKFIQDKIYARELIRLRKYENYQRRF